MGDDDLAERVAALLGGRTIATAESCTAGRIAEVLAAVDKASEFLRGGLVADEELDGSPPGTVYIATSVEGRVTSRVYRFDGPPEAVCDQARRQALLDLLAAPTP